MTGGGETAREKMREIWVEERKKKRHSQAVCREKKDLQRRAGYCFYPHASGQV